MDIRMEIQDTKTVGHFEWTDQYREFALGMRPCELRTHVYFRKIFGTKVSM